VSPEGLAQVKDGWQTPLCKAAVWLLFAGLIFHLFAGVRHLLMDIHLGDSLVAGRWGARLVLLATLLAMVAITIWMWR